MQYIEIAEKVGRVLMLNWVTFLTALRVDHQEILSNVLSAVQNKYINNKNKTKKKRKKKRQTNELTKYVHTNNYTFYNLQQIRGNCYYYFYVCYFNFCQFCFHV